MLLLVLMLNSCCQHLMWKRSGIQRRGLLLCLLLVQLRGQLLLQLLGQLMVQLLRRLLGCRLLMMLLFLLHCGSHGVSETPQRLLGTCCR